MGGKGTCEGSECGPLVHWQLIGCVREIDGVDIIDQRFVRVVASGPEDVAAEAQSMAKAVL